MGIMPNTVSSKEIQISYKAIFQKAMRLKEPIVVLKNNKPQVAIVDIETLDEMKKKIEELEMLDAVDSIRSYEEDKKHNRLIKLKSLKELIDKK